MWPKTLIGACNSFSEFLVYNLTDDFTVIIYQEPKQQLRLVHIST